PAALGPRQGPDVASPSATSRHLPDLAPLSRPRARPPTARLFAAGAVSGQVALYRTRWRRPAAWSSGTSSGGHAKHHSPTSAAAPNVHGAGGKGTGETGACRH